MSTPHSLPTFSRPLGDSELSYFLPSRKEGVNDMYLHLSFCAYPHLITPRRLALAWTIMRVRHPLLGARVEMDLEDEYGAKFVYMPPPSPLSALLSAQHTLLLRHAPKQVLIDAYLNGPRTLSNDRLAMLIVSGETFRGEENPGVVTPPATPGTSGGEFSFTPQPQEFDLLLCAAHFLGDGIALHTCANEFFMLLAAPAVSHYVPEHSSLGAEDVNAPLSDTALHCLMEHEWSVRWGAASPYAADGASPLPPSLESRLAAPSHTHPHQGSDSLSPAASPLSTFQRVAHNLAFRRAQARLVGGHSFARVTVPSPLSPASPLPVSRPNTKQTPTRTHQTLLRTYAFPPGLSAHILARCKRHGVSVSHVLFGGCAVGWGRVGGVRGVRDTEQGDAGVEERRKWEQLPLMMYSALNLRPHLAPPPDSDPRASYWFLAVGYFNVVLPVFGLPGDEAALASSSSTSTSTGAAPPTANRSKTATTKTVLHRAHLAKQQTATAARHPLLRPYALRMARERGERARVWAGVDDAAERDAELAAQALGEDAAARGSCVDTASTPTSLDLAPPSPPTTPPTTPVATRASTPPPIPQHPRAPEPQLYQEAESSKNLDSAHALASPSTFSSPSPASGPASSAASSVSSSTASASASASASAASTAPSKALIGLSLLGNLDAIYKHDTYTNLSLHTLTTGSRQRSGSALLFGYTFKGRLWVSLGWDGGAYGGEGARGQPGVVWEGVERESAGGKHGDDAGLEDQSGARARESEGMGGMSIVGPEGEMGRWWREVVGVLGEVFAEGEGCA